MPIPHILFMGLLVLGAPACLDSSEAAGETTASAPSARQGDADQEPRQLPEPDLTGFEETESGLHYKAVERGPGEGPHPKLGDVVVVHYRGTLTDGTKFDASRDHPGGQPAEFALGRVIEGWNEGLQLMRPGDTFEFVIPPELGYGERGSPPRIPASATLVFEVELIEVKAVLPFARLDAGETMELPSGLRYQVIEAGEGKRPGEEDLVKLAYHWWGDDEVLRGCSVQNGQNIVMEVGELPLDFMAEAVQQLQVGATARFAVPPELSGGEVREGKDQEVTWWALELIEILEPMQAPEFRLPDDEELTTTGSGLRYLMLAEGEGASPEPTSTVTVHYAGWLTDGTGFDNSYERGEPASFPVGGVIPGWTEGLQLLKPGGEAIFVIPSELAYGPRGGGEVIPPNADLVFHVELISVE